MKTPITGNHTTIRKYYIIRNWHYYITRYEKGMDRIRQYYRMMKFAVKVVIYETDKKEKGMAMFQGYTDAKKLKKEINEKNIHGEDGK